MKLVRFGPLGQEKPGLLDTEGRLRDLSGRVADFAGNAVSLAALSDMSKRGLGSAPLVEGHVRLGSPLAWVSNFYCIGLNYAAHAAETGAPQPSEPVVFSKAASSLAGPEDDIIIPKGASCVDWEVELGVVIGAPALNISKARALEHVAGYVAVNDVSERIFQKDRGGQWIKGKSAPSFGKIGPWFVTRDEVPDPQALELALAVNGVTRQHSNASDMIFSVAEIVAYMSQFMQLVPGDVIATGTPSGVGLGITPPQYLRPDDTVTLEVAGLGRQVSKVVAA